MDEPLDEQYFKWLYHQVASIRFKNPARTYWSLLRQLFTKEYVGWLPNDDNRVEDGRDLRTEFVKEYNLDADPVWMGMGCSIFEMLIGLARRLAFETERESRDWFWEMLENLDLRKYSDLFYDRENDVRSVDGVLDCLVSREYSYSGEGGLFPLQRPRQDQRQVELWYQLSAYLLERS